MVITLIGYRGSGKTSVARHLAALQDAAWVDSDDVIENQAGRSIRTIFSDDGEAEFRRLECNVICELTARESPLVIAAGGGAILSAENRSNMRAAGPVVWLQAAVGTLAARIQQDQTSGDRRPSLTGQSILDEVGAVLQERRPLYAAAASFTIDTDGLTPQQIAAEIHRQLSAGDTTA